MKQKLYDTVLQAVKNLYPEINISDLAFTVENTTNTNHGDFATNIAMQIAKLLKKNPRETAAILVPVLKDAVPQLIEKIEIAGPGFINFYIKQSAFHNWLEGLIKSDSYLKSNIGKNKKVMVEFVSANPTGPLHIGHGRGAAIGDSTANILEAVGYDVHREYYVNDAGNQMVNLAASIYSRYCELQGVAYPFPEDGYKGEYIADIAKDIYKVYSKKLLDMTEQDALAICKRVGIKHILNNSIDTTLKNFNVQIDKYFSEQTVYDTKEIDVVVDKLHKVGATYEKEGALWLATAVKGDEDDRVLKKSDGTYTYLTPDIAYHMNKFNRGFDLAIDVWGSDHHGYIKRMEVALEYLGYPKNHFDVILVQMVSLIRNGEKVKMSTRAGEFITLDWLIDEVGVDAARFFYNMRSGNSQFEFDVDLAKEKSSNNPVFYIQYSHARIHSIMKNATEKGYVFKEGADLEQLTLEQELLLIKKLMAFKSTLETAATYNEPHRISFYLQELAAELHSYYNSVKIIHEDNDAKLVNARLNLIFAVAKTIKFGLKLLGVSAPNRM